MLISLPFIALAVAISSIGLTLFLYFDSTSKIESSSGGGAVGSLNNVTEKSNSSGGGAVGSLNNITSKKNLYLNLDSLSFSYLLSQGDLENTTVDVKDSSSAVGLVDIFLTIDYSDGTVKTLQGKTNNKGMITIPWAVEKSGPVIIRVDASKEGFNPATTSYDFCAIDPFTLDLC